MKYLVICYGMIDNIPQLEIIDTCDTAGNAWTVARDYVKDMRNLYGLEYTLTDYGYRAIWYNDGSCIKNECVTVKCIEI